MDFLLEKKQRCLKISDMRIIPLICYESVVPNVVAQSVGYDAAGKVFVVASQNGWYKSRFQVQQHSSLSSIRAVENRVPLVHSINNGFSSITMPEKMEKSFSKLLMKKQGLGFLKCLLIKTLEAVFTQNIIIGLLTSLEFLFLA